MFFASCQFTRFQQAFARGLNRAHRNDDEDFRHAVVLLRGNQYAGDFGVDGQPRHLFAETGEPVAGFGGRWGVGCFAWRGLIFENWVSGCLKAQRPSETVSDAFSSFDHTTLPIRLLCKYTEN